ncbi:FG-GAP-like repeat-containing protein [Paenarthrobacter sp. NCHU4564]|uniref:FG-GAP-like repeat-containing protein n=1 Tax=Paenarthrobacter sp. NCHU4564 TaxID=3451353 RepID=UPI003F99104E
MKPVTRGAGHGFRRVLLGALATALLLASSLTGGPANADDVTHRVNAGSGAAGVAVNPLTNTVYVATRTGVTVVDGKTHATRTVALGGAPAAIAVNAASNRIYASMTGSGTVAVLNGATLSVTKVAVGPEPKTVAVNQLTNKIYVATNAGVSVINGNTNSTVAIGMDRPSQLVVNQASNRVYAVAGGLKAIDGITHAVTSIPLGNSVLPIRELALTQSNNKVYVASSLRSTMVLEVVDGATNAATVLYSDSNSYPTALAVDETANTVYLGRSQNSGSAALPQTGVLSIFSGSGTKHVPTGSAPGDVAVNRMTKKAYLKLGAGAGVYDPATSALSTFSTGPVNDLAVNYVTNKAYITTSQGPMAVIDGDMPTPLKNDFSGDRTSDLLAIDPQGLLWLYPGNGAGGWLPRAQVGSDWNPMTAVVSPGDVNGDRKPDVLARDSAGYLWMYPGNGSGGWLPRLQVGSGWNDMSALAAPGDFNGDGHPDVLARDGSGTLWLYPGNGKGGWLPRASLGTGWNATTAILGPGDFDTDGAPDVLARDGSGTLWLHPGNGKGGWLSERRQVGQGWNVMNALVAPGDFNGDGRPDVLARDAGGALILYPGAGAGGWLPVSRVGQGWEFMRFLL